MKGTGDRRCMEGEDRMHRLTRRGELDGGAYAASDNASILERLCQLEDGMEAGTTVLLPIENGETIWTVGFDGCAKIHPFCRKIRSQEIRGNGEQREIILHCKDCSFRAEDEGKSWWRTEGEAKAFMDSRPGWYVPWRNMGPRHEEYGRFAAPKE